MDCYKNEKLRQYKVDENSDIREASMSIIKNVGMQNPDEVIPLIINELDNKNNLVKQDVYDILSDLSKDLTALLNLLINAYASSAVTDKNTITSFIIDIGKKQTRLVIPILQEQMNNRNIIVRAETISALGSLIPYSPKSCEQLAPILIEKLMKERSNEVKKSIANTLTIISFLNISVFKDNIKEIIIGLKDNYYFVRWRIAQIIKNIGIINREYVVDTIPALINSTEDSNPLVKDKAKEALDTLKIDRFEYRKAMTYIVEGSRIIEKMRKNDAKRKEIHMLLIDAIKSIKTYDFGHSIYLSTTAITMMEEAGISLGSSMYTPAIWADLEQYSKFSIDSHRCRSPKGLKEDVFSFTFPEAKTIKKGKASDMGIDELFLMTTYGILIEHIVFRQRSIVDKDILGSMLIAVKNFIKDSFDLPESIAGEKIFLNTIDFGKFSVVIATGKDLILVGISESGNKNRIFRHLSSSINRIEKKYENILLNWRGEVERLIGISDYLQKVVL